MHNLKAFALQNKSKQKQKTKFKTKQEDLGKVSKYTQKGN